MDGSERAPAGHNPQLVPRPLPRTPFQRAMLRLTGYEPTDGRAGKRDGRRAAMLRAIDNRASWPALRSWLRGDIPAPQWVVDLVATKLMEYAIDAQTLRQLHKPGPGYDWKRKKPPE